MESHCSIAEAQLKIPFIKNTEAGHVNYDISGVCFYLFVFYRLWFNLVSAPCPLHLEAQPSDDISHWPSPATSTKLTQYPKGFGHVLGHKVLGHIRVLLWPRSFQNINRLYSGHRNVSFITLPWWSCQKPEQNNESLSVPLYQEIKSLILNSSLTIKYLVNFQLHEIVL